jgi:hypothetical protein
MSQHRNATEGVQFEVFLGNAARAEDIHLVE